MWPMGMLFFWLCFAASVSVNLRRGSPPAPGLWRATPGGAAVPMPPCKGSGTKRESPLAGEGVGLLVERSPLVAAEPMSRVIQEYLDFRLGLLEFGYFVHGDRSVCLAEMDLYRDLGREVFRLDYAAGVPA